MRENLKHCLDLIYQSEKGFSNRSPKDDPGGATQDGVTLSTLSAWEKRPVTVEELRKLPAEKREAIFTAQYADTISFDELPSGLDYCVFDCSVNSGPNRAGRILQEAIGMTGHDVDGVIGAKTKATLKATTATDISRAITAYSDDRLAFMKTLRNWGANKNGWQARVHRVEEEALHLTAGVPAMIDRPDLPPTASAKAAGPTKLISIPSGKAAIATAGSVAATAATAVTQATDILQPYADVGFVRNILLGLAVVSAGATLMVAITRTRAGATT